MASEYQWNCHDCNNKFRTEDALINHANAYKVRAQELILELQLVLAHSGLDPPTDLESRTLNNGEGRKGFYCPHLDCKNKPPYTEHRSRQRHFAIHIKCPKPCPSCARRFSNVRQYENHLQACLRNSGPGRGASKKLGKRLHKLVLNKLERLLLDDTETLTTSNSDTNTTTTDLFDSVQTVGIDVMAMDESCHTRSSAAPTDMSFSSMFTTNTKPQSHRYSRGPALETNPMEWSLGLLPNAFGTSQNSLDLYPQPDLGSGSADATEGAIADILSQIERPV